MDSDYVKRSMAQTLTYFNEYPEASKNLKTVGLCKKNTYLLGVILLELGKTYKSKLLDGKERIHINELLNKGYTVLQEYLSEGKSTNSDMVEFLHEEKLFEEFTFFRMHGFFRDFPVTRDATASTLQV
jgi:hypothetical protein